MCWLRRIDRLGIVDKNKSYVGVKSKFDVIQLCMQGQRIMQAIFPISTPKYPVRVVVQHNVRHVTAFVTSISHPHTSVQYLFYSLYKFTVSG